jgi:thiol-disulfide isomerase/thioredoxin
MNRDNISALLTALAVISLIVGFAIYFNSPELNTVGGESIRQQQLIDKILTPEPSESVSSESTANRGSSDGEKARNMLVEPASTRENNPVVIKLNRTEFDEIDRSKFREAPNFEEISGYINTNDSKPLDLQSLKGNVVLVDFWTYSCINYIRTIPYLNDWYEKYSDKGLTIVGVHTPEFEFEKNFNNVKSAVDKFQIKYPVLQDNDKGTWNAYENRYWPRKYIIDTEGNIRYDHIGEGAYSETEKVLQYLLAERAAKLGRTEITFSNISNSTVPAGGGNSKAIEIDFSKIQTPEIYLGYQLAQERLGNTENFQPDRTVSYTIAHDNNSNNSSNTDFKPNMVYLEGRWKNNPDNIELQSEMGRIVLNYSAKSVNIVAGGPLSATGRVSVDNFTNLIDAPMSFLSSLSSNSQQEVEEGLGANISDGMSQFSIDSQRLYNLVNNNEYGQHVVTIDIRGKGFKLYIFTFG